MTLASGWASERPLRTPVNGNGGTGAQTDSVKLGDLYSQHILRGGQKAPLNGCSH